ncbi:MAG TPA: A24 family peptidase [Alphaproteobacteria bacterium]|nr:A24 family peptidase [Alphaproteobacteria bacterium]
MLSTPPASLPFDRPLWAVLLLAAALTGLAVSDWRRMLLPDWLTLPLIAAGLALAAWTAPEALPERLLGAGLGFALLAGVALLYRALRGRDGLGGGDAKLFAAAGAWVGWQGLPAVLLVASLGALAVVGARRLAGRPLGPGDALAFGPYLCLGFFLVWLMPGAWLAPGALP